MRAESLEVLEKANVPAPQARAFVRAIEIELDGARDVLATKHDMELLRQDIAGLRHELKGDIAGLRHELKQDMAELRTNLEGKIDASARNMLRQMYLAMLAQMGILVGIVLTLMHAGR